MGLPVRLRPSARKGCWLLLARGSNSFTFTISPQQHFQHVHHATLFLVCGLLQGPLESRRDSQIQCFALCFAKSHEMPRECLCNCVILQASPAAYKLSVDPELHAYSPNYAPELRLPSHLYRLLNEESRGSGRSSSTSPFSSREAEQRNLNKGRPLNRILESLVAQACTMCFRPSSVVAFNKTANTL